jgi:Glycosyl transferase family 2
MVAAMPPLDTPPRISVIVPAYNVAPYIGEALASLQAQTLIDFEAIVIDDGSTDATAAAIAPFLADARFRLIQTENAGLAATRNRGLAEVRSEFVAMLDGDDRYRPDYLAVMLARIAADPDIAFVTCDAESFTTGSDQVERFSSRYAQSEPVTIAGFLGGRTHVFGLCTLRTAALRSVNGYDPALRAAEDLDLWLRLLGGGHVGGWVPRVLVDYRRRTGSLSDDRPKLMTASARAYAKAATALAGTPEADVAARKRDEATAIAQFETGVDLAITGQPRKGIDQMRASGLKSGNRKWQAIFAIISLLPLLAPHALTLYRRGNQFA